MRVGSASCGSRPRRQRVTVDDVVIGEINNEPYGHIGHKLGDRVNVPGRDISDWAYSPAGSKEMVGGFTIKVMMKREGK